MDYEQNPSRRKYDECTNTNVLHSLDQICRYCKKEIAKSQLIENRVYAGIVDSKVVDSAKTCYLL